MHIDPSTTKYLIRALITTDGVVEKPDVVGAIFGQTEGLLGEELDLRDLQKNGKIGRIEVEVSSKRGKGEGEVLIPSSLDQVETAILASALETIDRVGPCKAEIKIKLVEDVRIAKKKLIVRRAKEILGQLLAQSKTSGEDLTETVRQAVQIQEMVSYGADKCPAGPNVEDTDAIIVVEGRSDVLNLLKYGIKNAIAVEGTNVPKTIQELSEEKVVTAFVDGDRGGELILKELLQVAEVDFIARAPRAHEVEELTQKQMIKALRNKVPAEQFHELYSIGNGRGGKDKDTGRGRREKEHNRPERKVRDDKKPAKKDDKGKKLSPELRTLKTKLKTLQGSSKANFLNKDGNVIMEMPVRDLSNNLAKGNPDLETIVFDGIITQRLLDLSAEAKVKTVVGTKLGNITKQPTNIKLWTRADLE